MAKTHGCAPRWTHGFLLALAVWTAGMAGGYAVVQAASELPSDLPTPVVAEDARTGHAPGMPEPEAAPGSDAGLVAFIFRRNLSVYIWILAGLLSAGAVTFVVLLANGIMLGHTIGLAHATGVAPAMLSTLLLPHGVLEVGTFCIAGAVGFQGFRIASDWGRNGWSAVRSLRLGLVLAYGAVALAVAAVLETFVTGALADAMGLR
ncbi:MAG: stage II sporulation protein M [Gammaproteobacteria bacterium]|nr:stage II sporulation protein M [Gammaproteobacteria bacterium]